MAVLPSTARLPYGTKSKEAIERYTLEAARFLQAKDIKFLVVACNTVSAQAFEAVQREMPALPYCGVISAGAEAVVKTSPQGRIAVLATEGTVRSGVYADIIENLRPNAQVHMLSCNLLVALVEEGWFEGREAEALVARYLSMLPPGYDTIVLGCTHFPLLAPVLRKLCAPEIRIVDTALATAEAVAGILAARDLLNPESLPGRDLFCVTDMPERFARLGSHFLGRDIAAEVTEVKLIAHQPPYELTH